MKSRKMMSMFLSAMFILVTALMPMSAGAEDATITKYLDVTPSADGVWTNAAGDATFGQISIGSDLTPTYTKTVNPVTGKASMLISAPNGTVAKNCAVGNNAIGLASATLTSSVVWYEFDILYQDQVSNTAFIGNATNLLNINVDGSVKLAHYQLSNCCVAGTIKPNIPYHIVIAVDPLSATTNRAIITLWINGVQSGSANRGDAAVYSDLSRVAINATGCTNAVNLYIDRVQLYTSTVSVPNSGFDPMADFAGCDLEVTDDSMLLLGDTLYVDEGTKLATVKEGISADGTISYSNTDSTATAIGEKIYVASTTGVGVKVYSIVKKDKFMLADNLYDINYNDSTTTNSAGSLALNYRTDSGCKTPALSYDNDAVKGNMAYKHTYTSKTGPYIIRQQTIGLTGLDTDKKTIWYEMSFKFGGNVSKISFQPGTSVFAVDATGALYLGADSTPGAHGTARLAEGVAIETDKWYNIKIAVDWSELYLDDTYNTYNPRFYAWLNDELITLDGNEDYSFIWTTRSTGTKNAVEQLILSITPTADNDTLTIDDFKVYTTYTPVRAEDGSLNVREGWYDDFADFDSSLVVKGDKIYVPASVETIADVAAKITNGTVVDSTGADISSSQESAIDETIYVRSSNGVGAPAYTIAAQSYALGTVTVGDGTAPTVSVTNTTPGTKTVTFILVTKGADGIVDLSVTADKTLAVGTADVALDAVGITGATSYSLYVWDSMTGLKPIFADVPGTIPAA